MRTLKLTTLFLGILTFSLKANAASVDAYFQDPIACTNECKTHNMGVHTPCPDVSRYEDRKKLADKGYKFLCRFESSDKKINSQCSGKQSFIWSGSSLQADCNKDGVADNNSEFANNEAPSTSAPKAESAPDQNVSAGLVEETDPVEAAGSSNVTVQSSPTPTPTPTPTPATPVAKAVVPPAVVVLNEEEPTTEEKPNTVVDTASVETVEPARSTASGATKNAVPASEKSTVNSSCEYLIGKEKENCLKREGILSANQKRYGGANNTLEIIGDGEYRTGTNRNPKILNDQNLSAEERSQTYLDGIADRDLSSSDVGAVTGSYLSDCEANYKKSMENHKDPNSPLKNNSKLSSQRKSVQSTAETRRNDCIENSKIIALTQTCEGRNSNEIANGENERCSKNPGALECQDTKDGKEGKLSSKCSSINEGKAHARQQQTEGQIPGNFQELKHNQGLFSFYDPSLPEDRYLNSKAGTVKYPNDDEQCEAVAPSDKNKIGNTKGFVENISSSEFNSQLCPIGEGQNYFATGEIQSEGLICEKARADGCPGLNNAFRICDETLANDISESDEFQEFNKMEFVNNICSETYINRFKLMVANAIYEDHHDEINDQKPTTKINSLYSSIVKNHLSEILKDLQYNADVDAKLKSYIEKLNALPKEKMADKIPGTQNPNLISSLDEEAKFFKACSLSCKRKVLYKLTSEEFIQLLPTDYQSKQGVLDQFPKTPYQDAIPMNADSGEEFPEINFGVDGVLEGQAGGPAKGLRHCVERAYSVKRNVYMRECTALRSMSRYGTQDDFKEAMNDLETVSWDGKFRCIRPSIFTVDYESCKALLNVYNAGLATEMVGQEGMAINDQIQNQKFQERANQAAMNGEQTSQLDLMSDSMTHQKNNEIAKASFYGINVAALGTAMAMFTTPSSVEGDCAESLGSVTHGYRCLDAAHYLVSENPQYGNEFFANKAVLDQFYGVVIQKLGASLISGLKAHLYARQARMVKDVKDKFVNPDFVQGGVAFDMGYCQNNPTAEICQSGSGGRTRRAGLDFSGFSAGNAGGGAVDLSAANVGEYDGGSGGAANAKAIADLSNLMNNNKANSFGNDFKSPSKAKVGVGRGGAAGGGSASAASASGGGGGGAAAAGANGGDGKKSGITNSNMQFGGKRKGFATFSGRGKKPRSKGKNAFDKLLGNKGGVDRGHANIDYSKILPKNIGLFDKISERYGKVNGENRLYKIDAKGKK